MYFILGQTSLLAQGGVKIIRAIDRYNSSDCIYPNKHNIYMDLRRIIIDKNAGFWEEDKSVGILLNIELEGRSLSKDRNTVRVIFPKLFEASLKRYEKGSTSIPLELMIFNELDLKNENIQLNTIRVELSILKKKDPTSFGIALSSLAKVTKNFPLPANPFSDAFKYFAQYTEDVVKDYLNSDNNVDKNIRYGAFTLNFSPNGNCVGGFEKTGSIAFVEADNENIHKKGIVDIKNEYCWISITSEASFDLKFAPMPENRKCNEVLDNKFELVNNPYILFVLNARESN